MIHGRNLLIYADGKAIAAARSCTIRLETERIERSDPSDGKSRFFLTGRTEWSVTVGKLVTDAHSDLELADRELTLSFVVRDQYNNLTGDRMTGTAIVVTSEISGDVGSLARGSLHFQGTGPLIRVMDKLRDYDEKDMRDVDENQLMVPSSNL